MELTLELPRQRTTVPILAVSILLGLLLSPVLERALESWMPVASSPPTSGASDRPGSGAGGGSNWDLRTMWQ